MPVEAKPLFRPDVLRSHLSGFQLPVVDSTKLDHWASEIASGRVDRFGEQEILPNFLNDFFPEILDYTGPAGQDRYTIGFERFVEVEVEFSRRRAWRLQWRTTLHSGGRRQGTARPH